MAAEHPTPRWRRIAARWGPLAALLAAIALAYQLGWFGYLSLEQITNHREELVALVETRYLLALTAFAAVYVAAVAASLPVGAFLTMVGGFLFGVPVGAATAVVAATLGATLFFLIARTSLGAALAERAGPRLDRLRDGLKQDALSYLLFLRLVPAFPFWLVNLAPALLGVALRTYVLGTFIGIIPGTVAFTFLGAGLDSVIADRRAAYEACMARAAEGETCRFSLEPGSLLTPELIAAFVCLGLIALIPVAARYIRRRRGK